MPIFRSTYAFIFSVMLCCSALPAYAQTTDSTSTKDSTNKQKIKLEDHRHQLRIGVDIVPFIKNSLSTDHSAYNIQVDYYFRKEVYFAMEAGFGSSNKTDSFLSFTTSNPFIAVGVDKCMLTRLRKNDWDMAFIGLRLGFAPIHRGEATYITNDFYFGKTHGTIPSTNFMANWVELTAGIKVELLKDFFAGWSVHGRFLISGTALKELPPTYIAGYGRGDNTTAFDFNFYVSYAIRWHRQ